MGVADFNRIFNPSEAKKVREAYIRAEHAADLVRYAFAEFCKIINVPLSDLKWSLVSKAETANLVQGCGFRYMTLTGDQTMQEFKKLVRGQENFEKIRRCIEAEREDGGKESLRAAIFERVAEIDS